ncbi:MAG: hypothetical protein Q9187_002403, partial [Circinaria calcarea]
RSEWNEDPLGLNERVAFWREGERGSGMFLDSWRLMRGAKSKVDVKSTRMSKASRWLDIPSSSEIDDNR